VVVDIQSGSESSYMFGKESKSLVFYGPRGLRWERDKFGDLLELRCSNSVFEVNSASVDEVF